MYSNAHKINSWSLIILKLLIQQHCFSLQTDNSRVLQAYLRRQPMNNDTDVNMLACFLVYHSIPSLKNMVASDLEGKVTLEQKLNLVLLVEHRSLNLKEKLCLKSCRIIQSFRYLQACLRRVSVRKLTLTERAYQSACECRIKFSFASYCAQWVFT